MKGKRGKKRIEGLREAIWITLPRNGQVLKKLDKNGVVHVTGENPGFVDAPYCVCLGLRVGERGPIRYGTLDSPGQGDYFYAEVHEESGLFDIHLKAQSLSNKKVMIRWFANSEGTRGTLGPTPTLGIGPDIRYKIEHFNPKDFPGRSVDEVPGIDAEYTRCLTSGGIDSLPALASAQATDVVSILGISEVCAMGFIYEARLLLQGKPKQ
jgi:hypothetical protein